MYGMPEESGKKYPVKNGAIVQLMMLGTTQTYLYLKALEAENASRKEEAKELGRPFKPLKPNYKDGGMAIKCAILAQDNEAVPFNQSAIVYFEMPTPDQIYAKPNGAFKYEKGGTLVAYNGKPKISALIPSAKPSIIYDEATNKPISIDSLNLDDALVKEQYRDLIVSEEYRVTAWENILKYWDSVTEAKAVEDLGLHFAKLKLLCNLTDSKVNYILPKLGLTFTAQAVIANEYLNFVTIDRWNKETKSYTLYSDLKVTEPTTEDEEYAIELVAKEMAFRKEAIAKKAVKKDTRNLDDASSWGDDAE